MHNPLAGCYGGQATDNIINKTKVMFYQLNPGVGLGPKTVFF